MTTISLPINLANTEVINTTSLENGDIIVRVKSTEIGTCCKYCGKMITKYHSLNKTLVLNHLPAFGNCVFIEIQPIRFQCLECEGHPTTTQKLSWYQIEGKFAIIRMCKFGLHNNNWRWTFLYTWVFR